MHLEPEMLKTNLKSPLFLDSKDLGDGISRGLWEATRRYTPEYALTRVSDGKIVQKTWKTDGASRQDAD